MQCVGDGVHQRHQRGHGCDESAYFGGREFDELSVNVSWRFESGWFVG